MGTPKVSIIVPVYNAGSYFSKLLDSLTGQTLKEIEIILVLDCPTDGSDRVAEEYAARDGRIVLVRNRENLHVGFSRNEGAFATTTIGWNRRCLKRCTTKGKRQERKWWWRIIGFNGAMKNGQEASPMNYPIQNLSTDNFQNWSITDLRNITKAYSTTTVIFGTVYSKGISLTDTISFSRTIG